MLNFHLSLTRAQQEALAQELHKANSRGDWQGRQRILAILSLAEGMCPERIAAILRVSLEAIRLWVKRFLTVSIKEFAGRKPAPGRPPKLSKSQRHELAALIEQGPQAAGFAGGCWRTPMIQELVKERFGIFYNVRYLSQLLRNMGFSYQKARFETGGHDPNASTSSAQETRKHERTG